MGSLKVIITVLMLGVTTKAYSQSTVPSRVSAARDAFAQCIINNSKVFGSVAGALPSGVAFFVGLTCGRVREDYRQSLLKSGMTDAETVLQVMDAHAIDFVLKEFAKNRPD